MQNIQLNFGVQHTPIQNNGVQNKNVTVPMTTHFGLTSDRIQFSSASDDKSIEEEAAQFLPLDTDVVWLEEKSHPFLSTYQVNFKTKRYLTDFRNTQASIAKRHTGSNMIVKTNNVSLGKEGWQWSCEVLVPAYERIIDHVEVEEIIQPDDNRKFFKYSITLDENLLNKKESVTTIKPILENLQEGMGYKPNEYGFYDVQKTYKNNGNFVYTWMRNAYTIHFDTLKERTSSTVVKGRDGDPSGRIEYRLETDFKLKHQDAQRIQLLSGKHPEGYGFMAFKSVQNEATGKWITTWQRSGSAS